MRKVFCLTLATLLLAGCASKMDDKMGKKNMAHAHIGHVATGWKDTPDKKGLLPTAVAEAKIAAQHAGFAAKKLDDLGWMKAHTGHVLHALDPAVEAKGPGLGYGVRKAAAGAAKHIEFAAASEGASKNVKLHTPHVKTSAGNVGTWVGLIIPIGKQVQAAKTAAEAAPMVKKIKAMTTALIAGIDANSDGKVTWKKGEGGLQAAQKHMGFMMKGEKL